MNFADVVLDWLCENRWAVSFFNSCSFMALMIAIALLLSQRSVTPDAVAGNPWMPGCSTRTAHTVTASCPRISRRNTTIRTDRGGNPEICVHFFGNSNRNRRTISGGLTELNLTVDQDVFRGGIPEGVEQGVGVLFGSEVPSRGFYGFRPRTWNVHQHRIAFRNEGTDHRVRFHRRV